MPSLTKVPGKAMTVSHFATAVDYLTEKEVYNPAHWTPEYLRERYNSGHGFDYCLAAVKGFADSGVSASEDRFAVGWDGDWVFVLGRSG